MTSPVTEATTLESAPSTHAERRGGWFLLPLIAILAVQAGLSLILIWSNTAFGDEADYLWLGHRLIAHWLHGATWPSSYGDRQLSGSPLIYPPIGALADSVGGIAGARILSLLFMLGATVLLYLTAARLFGRAAALFACALWAMTQPTLRLAFATFDPLSVLLTALSAWLMVQAGYRRHRGEFVAAAAAAFALSVATTYSMIVMVPFIVGFAFLVWLDRMDTGQAASCAAWLVGAMTVFFGVLMTASRSWEGLSYSVLARTIRDPQSRVHLFNDVWQYAWLVICLAVIGMLTAIFTDGRQRAAMLVVLGLAVFAVPAAQLTQQTGTALDKHLAFGIWFGAMAGGYACTRLFRWRPGASKPLIAACCAVALGYIGLTAWESAWQTYRGWPNARAYVATLRPIVADTDGLIFSSGQDHIGEYYTPQGSEWTRWSAALQLDPAVNPVSVPQNRWGSYYRQQLKSRRFGLIILFYKTTLPPAQLPPIPVPLRGANVRYQELKGLSGANFGEEGVPALTQVLTQDSTYYLAAQGAYSGGHTGGGFAIWRKTPA